MSLAEQILAIDLCAGAGGWACAARGLPITIVAAVDLWEPACVTYRLNHPGTEVICGDVRERETQERILELSRKVKIDLVLGGIPCAWLSIRRNVGNQPEEAEMENERATLRAVLSLVERIGPTWWCLEDVKRLAAELPAGMPWRELDAADFSAQRRKRIYVGRFPTPPGFGPLLDAPSERVAADCLRSGPYRIGKRTFGREPSMSDTFAVDKCYVANPAKKAPTICCTSSRRDPEYVIADDRLPGGMRQIEWQEAAALQGFPADYLFYGSPTDVWYMVGRAVQIDTARAILRGIVQAKQDIGKSLHDPPLARLRKASPRGGKLSGKESQ